jgi:hypothetical protein
LIANGIEGGERRVSNGRGLLKCEVRRLCQEVVLTGTRILGEGAVAPAENFVTRLKLLYVAADRLNLPGHVDTRYLAPWLGQSDRRAHDVRRAPEEVPVADIDDRCADANQYLVVCCDRLVDVLELQDIG